MKRESRESAEERRRYESDEGWITLSASMNKDEQERVQARAIHENKTQRWGKSEMKN